MTILVISPHPDDETLGAGGTMLRYKSEGKEVHWLNITNIKEEYGYSSQYVIKRREEIQKAKELYQVNGFYDLGLEPTGLDKYVRRDIVNEIGTVIEKVRPSLVIAPYYADIHSDHRIVWESIHACTKVFRYPFIKQILAMEILSETDFVQPVNTFLPNYFVDITDTIDKKQEIMSIYASELGEHPFPRSLKNIKALATLRGATSGVKYAEAFMLIKHIE